MKNLLRPKTLLRLTAAVILLVVMGIYAGRYLSGLKADLTNKSAKELYYGETSEKQETAIAENKADEIESNTEASVSENEEEQPQEVLPEIAEDFKELLAINSEIVGWLTAGDNIDYPVVQGDNDYYLNYNFKKESDSNGAIFLNSCNTLFPRDDILLIHGHRMASGRMFGSLGDYSSFNYIRKNPIVMFRTIYDSEPVYYTPVAAFNASQFKLSWDYFDIAQVLFENDKEQPENGRASREFSEYLDKALARSDWQPLVDVGVDDSYINLITCSYNREEDDRRLCVLCRKLRPDETPESIIELYENGAAN